MTQQPERFDPEGYDIAPNMLEVYKRAWWVDVDGEKELRSFIIDTMSQTRSYDGRGFYEEVEDPRHGTAKGLADRIVQIENETDYGLITIVTHSSGMGTAFFRRKQVITLQIPKKLDLTPTEEPVTVPERVDGDEESEEPNVG